MSPYHQPEPTVDVSIVVPIYNERDNIRPLVEDIVRAAGRLERSFEIILVNDGSDDGSAVRLDEAAAVHPQVRVIHFAHNCGQTLALAAGLYHARGRVLVPLDGDRQNDPADISALLARLEEGYDCVSGWRQKRQDSGLRRLPSRLANRLINSALRVPIHDLGCTLKAYRREILDPEELFGEMHRFLAACVVARGGRIAELVVNHHPRRAGVSKYGLNRTVRVLFDLLLMRVLFKYRTRPGHAFAAVAQYPVLAAGLCGVWAVVRLALGPRSLAAVSLPLLAMLVLLAVAGGLVAAGLLAELTIRARFGRGGGHPWTVARTVNMGSATDSGANPVDTAETMG